MKISRQFKKSSLRTKVIKKIEGVSPDEWNKIYPDVPEGYHFLKTLDGSNFGQFSFYYILVYERKKLVGAAPCFTRTFPALFGIKALVCGIPTGQGHMGNILCSFDVVKAVEKRMESLAHKIHASLIVFKDFDRSYDKPFEPLLKDGFLKIDSLPMTRLKLDFSDFEDYLKTLSRATRYDLRRKFKRSSSVKIASSVESSLDETTLKEAYSLYLQALETHPKGLEIVPQEFFRLISKNMPGETKYFLFRINGKLAAFVFCLVSGDVLLDYYLGFDYTAAREYHLYFFKFKKVMDWCLANGIKTYEMGAAGYEPKRRLKFDLVPVYLYIKVRSKIMRPFLKCLRPLLHLMLL